METKWRWLALAAVAPIAWGSVYFVTRHALPADHPLWGGAIRALPAGILLLLVARRLPRGSWWWRSLLLGTLNVGAFFVLIYLAGQLLPTSLAATIMSLSPVVMMGYGWLLLSDRPRPSMVAGALIGILGVSLLVGSALGEVDLWGVAASLAALLMSGAGYVLSKRWGRGGPVLATTAWQLVAGGLIVLPVAVAVEGAPPALTLTSALAFGYLTLIGTAVAFLAWFAALARLPAGSVGLVGLLNPVTGVVLGLALGGERLGGWQTVGLVVILVGLLVGQWTPRSRGPAVVGRGLGRARPGCLAEPGGCAPGTPAR